MKVYVDNEDKDFLDACLSECKVYEYVADELQYSDRLKLVSLADHDKQVRKEVCEEIREALFEYLKVNSMEELESLSLLDSTLTYDVITDKLDQIQGETDAKD